MNAPPSSPYADGFEPVASAADIRAFEEGLVSAGVSLDRLIDEAAASVSRETLGHGRPLSRVLGLVGRGNNGRDAARALLRIKANGKRVAAVVLGADADSPEVRQLRDACELVVAAEDAEADDRIRAFRPDAVIDGLFGIGFRPPLSVPAARVLRCVNELPALRVAVDIPSGVFADSGAAGTEAFRADTTVTFFAFKLAHLVEPGRTLSGRVTVRYLGLSNAVRAFFGDRAVEATVSWVPPERWLAGAVPTRPASAHKKTATVLVVGGSRGMRGAPFLAAAGAFAGGAGFVAVASVREVVDTIGGLLPEAVCIELPETGGAIAEQATDAIARTAAEFDVVIVGPGLSREAGALRLAATLWRTLKVPAVFDGDALHALSEAVSREEFDGSPPAPRAVTPHAGEARVLGAACGLEPLTPELSPTLLARAIAERLDATCVMKESATFVATARRKASKAYAYVLPYGSPILATAGTGDLLAGLIGGFAAQGCDLERASLAATYVHQAASRRAARTIGAPATARQLIPYIAATMRETSGRIEGGRDEG